MTDYDLIVVGAGPAGMAAATTAAAHGANVTLLDEQPSAGGQIYRNIGQCDNTLGQILGNDYLYGRQLTEQLTASTVNHITNAKVWNINTTAQVTYTHRDIASTIQAKKLIIATGALERPYPVPGWTLPGVMTVGAAQIMLKSSAIAIEHAVLAGSGPLLYVVANQLIKAGCPPTAIVDTVQLSDYGRAARYFPLASSTTISKGLSAIYQIKKSGIPFYKAARNIKLDGHEQVENIQFNVKGKSQAITIDTDNVLLHQGVVPNTQLSRSLQLEHRWNNLQRCFHPVTDEWGTTSEDSIIIAGDGSGIGGAITAEHQGSTAALSALASLGHISVEERDVLASPLRSKLRKQKSLRRFLDTLYPPPSEALQPSDETIVCRCEEVTAGDIRSYAALGCIGPNQTKAFGRCGMGPCQGRYCSLTVTELLAHENKLSQDEVGSYRIRSPVKPVTLAELASLDVD